jgi:hypothetical protein
LAVCISEIAVDIHCNLCTHRRAVSCANVDVKSSMAG